MTFGELHELIDRNWDYDDILVLEFEGNDEWSMVRSDCIDLLKPILHYEVNSLGITDDGKFCIWLDGELKHIESLPPVEDMGEVSDGYHTFNQLYHQRAVLFATVVNQNKDKAWKSWKHEDGKFCFDKDGEWFIVGVDTPEGSYTYHYEKKYWDMFDCEELDRGKHWDGHTEEDVTRLLSLPPVEPKRPKTTETMMVDGEPTEIDPLSYEVGYSHGQSARLKGEWMFNHKDAIDLMFTRPKCSKCGFESDDGGNFCSNCGADMRGEK